MTSYYKWKTQTTIKRWSPVQIDSFSGKTPNPERGYHFLRLTRILKALWPWSFAYILVPSFFVIYGVKIYVALDFFALFFDIYYIQFLLSFKIFSKQIWKSLEKSKNKLYTKPWGRESIGVFLLMLFSWGSLVGSKASSFYVSSINNACYILII